MPSELACYPYALDHSILQQPFEFLFELIYHVAQVSRIISQKVFFVLAAQAYESPLYAIICYQWSVDVAGIQEPN